MLQVRHRYNKLSASAICCSWPRFSRLRVIFWRSRPQNGQLSLHILHHVLVRKLKRTTQFLFSQSLIHKLKPSLNVFSVTWNFNYFLTNENDSHRMVVFLWHRRIIVFSLVDFSRNFTINYVQVQLKCCISFTKSSIKLSSRIPSITIVRWVIVIFRLKLF